MAGKFSRSLIWPIGLQIQSEDFNLAVFFLRAMLALSPMRMKNEEVPGTHCLRLRLIWGLRTIF